MLEEQKSEDEQENQKQEEEEDEEQEESERDQEEELEGVDPNLNLQENISNDNNEILVSKDAKKQLSLSLLAILLRSKNISNSDKVKYKNLIQKIQNSDYYYIQADLLNQNNNQYLNQIYGNNLLESPVTYDIHDSLNYDFEFYKTGRKCGGLKKRYGIITNNGFYSSKVPLEKFNIDKAKEKTTYLNDSIINIENRLSTGKENGEWKNKEKDYRIRINYKDPYVNNNKWYSYFLYFSTEKQMREVGIMLFGMTTTNDDKKASNKTLKNMSNTLIQSNLLYTVLKILSVKNRIKKRKTFKNVLIIGFKGELTGKLNLGTPVFERLSLQRKETQKLKAFQKKILHNFKVSYNDSIPLISSINGTSNLKKNSLNNIIEKFKKLQKMKILKNNSTQNKQAVAFEIKGIQFLNISDANIRFNSEKSENIKYIYIDKCRPEIHFKEINDINKMEKGNYLGPKDLYEISNVILNCNINNILEDNSVVIYGPKINNNFGIEYKYFNNNVDFIDPELAKIKTPIFDQFNTVEGVNVLRLQIFQLEYEINENKLIYLNNNIYLSELKNSTLNPKNNLLIGYNINLSNLRKINSNFKFPNTYYNNICITEFNNEYYIPLKLIENNKFIIIFNTVPNLIFDKKISNELKNNLFKYFPSAELGYTEIDITSIQNGIYEYPIYLNGQKIPNSKIVLTGYLEKIPNLPLINIQGINYSIGNDSYCTKEIDKQFIDNAKGDPKINDEIKDKYFSVAFNDELPPKFLFRPNENMTQNEFMQNILSEKVGEEEKSKIFYNQKFPFLPMCEKFENEQKLYESTNLKTLPNDEKELLVKECNKNDWIYKQPRIKTKLLSKNLGITRDGIIVQYIYCINQKNIFNIKNLFPGNNVSSSNQELLLPINENMFNIFDKNELEYFKGLNNFQWKIEIKFNNELQMLSFVKLLKILRQEANSKMKDTPSENASFDYKKLLYLNPGKTEVYNSNQKYNFVIENIEFRKDYEIKNDCLLDIKILKYENNENNSLVNRLDVSKFKFKNSILQKPEIQNEYKRILETRDNGGVRFLLPKKAKLEKRFFNSSKKKFALKNIMRTSFPLTNNNNETYSIEIYFLSEKNKILEKFYTPSDIISKVINNRDIEMCEIPFFKKEDEKIYGFMIIDLWCNENDDQEIINQDEFIFKYYNKYIKFLQNPSLLLNNFEDSSYRFGLYEPNVFRRKILKLIHDLPINIDPTKLNEYKNVNNGNDIKILYNILYKKCVALPDIKNFENFDYTDIRKNFSLDINTNTYRRELGYKLIKFRKHEQFMKLFSQNEWKLFFKKLNINFDQINKYTLINSPEISEKFHNLIYTGIPNEYRLKTYHYLLETSELFEKTKNCLLLSKNVQCNTPQEIYSYFVNEVYSSSENIIFSLIDNDINYLNYFPNLTIFDINGIKKITKAFIKWTECDIRLENSDKGKYVYFIGILNIIQTLKNDFKDDYEIFWILIGLSQFIAHFHQQNPLFSDETNYINIFGLVTKLILECHHKDIYNKFISLNIPSEFFFSTHLSTLYTDYFKGDLMMRILDILIFESAYKEKYSDKLHYLRILCAIPITLMELSKKQILACESVSELSAIFEDLISHTLNINKFIFTLERNVNKFYVVKNIWEKLIFNNQGREWDAKRDKIQSFISKHFDKIYGDNNKYLRKIYNFERNQNNDFSLFHNFDKNYSDILNNHLNKIKLLYGQSNFKDSTALTGFDIHISKLQSLTIENINLDRFKLLMSFNDKDSNSSDIELDIIYDKINRIIKNIPDLVFTQDFEGTFLPQNVFFILCDKNYSKICSFLFDLSKCEMMKIDKIVLESREDSNKFFLEFSFFKYTTTNKILKEDFDLFKYIFNSPEYIHSINIEEQFSNMSVANSEFKNKTTYFIDRQNSFRNQIINSGARYENYLKDLFAQLNNFQTESNNNYNKKYCNNKLLIKILQSFLDNNEINIISNWLQDTNISFEEVLYSLVLIDTTSCSINEKLFLLYTIARAKDKLIFNNDEISIIKVKELIYSLYKRFMIYFTKTDVEKMIDFLVKDEKLFNIKYVFVYNQINEPKITDFIYDKDRYCPNNLKRNKNFEILYDNLDKELNIYLNHLNNYYNMNNITFEMLIYILTKIIDNKDTSLYQKNKYDTIKIIIVKDDIMYQRNFTINYSPLKILENNDSQIFVTPKNNKDITETVLCSEISNLETNNSYSGSNNYINFDKFKNIFFSLPYLSDLFRVSYSYISAGIGPQNREFESFKISVEFEDFCYGLFYFPKGVGDAPGINMENIHEMKTKIKLSDTVDSIVEKILYSLNNRLNQLTSNELMIKEYFNDPNKINCFVCKYINNKGGKIKEKIGFYDSLFSSVELKNSDEGEIIIELDMNTYSLGSTRQPVKKENGYCKIYYPLKGDFTWRKCKLKPKYFDDVNLASSDCKSKPVLTKNDVVLAYNI